MIAGAIFDLDGTILDSIPIWEQAAEVFLHSMGIEAEKGLGKTMFTMSMQQGAAFLKERYLSEWEVEAIIAGINRTIEDFYFAQVPLKDGAAEFLKAMKQAGIKMVAATSSDRRVVEGALKRLKIMDCFARIFTCTEIGAGKDQPDIYLAAAAFMGTRPEETWVFEDALYALETAKKAGFRTVGVFDAFSAGDQGKIKEISDFYLEKLADFDAFLQQAVRKRL
ncbi:MAG: HAD family phosphatase [Firmicutes bacterium]|nr:HAD family phosphatase [Bacillota bacterium]